MTRILLLDDHVQFREGLTSLLTATREFEVVADASSVEEGLRALALHPVDLVLLDYDLGGSLSLDFPARAIAAGFEGRLVLLTAGLPDSHAVLGLRSGITGIIFKQQPFASLLEAIRHVLAGKVWIDQKYLKALSVQEPPQKAQPNPLTDRERSVLEYILEGLTNKEIAGKVGASEAGVKSTLQQLFEKAGVRSRSQLVHWTLSRNGLGQR